MKLKIYNNENDFDCRRFSPAARNAANYAAHMALEMVAGILYFTHVKFFGMLHNQKYYQGSLRGY